MLISDNVLKNEKHISKYSMRVGKVLIAFIKTNRPQAMCLRTV